MNLYRAAKFDDIALNLGRDILTRGVRVDTGHWQATRDVPQTKSIELMDVRVDYEVPRTFEVLEKDVQPSAPWAEKQFQERIAGEPLNPGDTFTLWPWYKGNVERHKSPGIFSHTYMERFWPRRAGKGETARVGNVGVRYRYGDYDDLVLLLCREPLTRQAYMPIWFPEDTGAHERQRVPCTLGYHFMRRGIELHLWYDIRSCDFIRHFRDDVYMACRLLQETIRRCQSVEPDKWENVIPGRLSFSAHSLHVFEGDEKMMRRAFQK